MYFAQIRILLQWGQGPENLKYNSYNKTLGL